MTPGGMRENTAGLCGPHFHKSVSRGWKYGTACETCAGSGRPRAYKMSSPTSKMKLGLCGSCGAQTAPHRIASRKDFDSMCARHIAPRRREEMASCPAATPRCSKNAGEEMECQCPRRIQKVCRKRKIGSGKDVAEIMQALRYDASCNAAYKPKKPCCPPKIRYRPKCKPRCHKCIPMSPPMDQRIQYISHCDNEPPKRQPCQPPPRPMYECCMFSSDDEGKSKKKVQYKDDDPCGINMETAEHVVTHVPEKNSDKSIVSVPSPKTSGEKISAQKAEVEPKFYKPPLPPDATKKIVTPHSGIVYPDGYFPPQDVLPAPCKPFGENQICPDEQGLKRYTKCTKCKGSKKRRCSYHRRNPCCQMKRQKSRSNDDVCGIGEDVPPLEHPNVPECLKSGIFESHSLTVLPCKKERTSCLHYGILLGAFNMYDEKFGPKSRGRQGLCISVMAYCLAFHYHPKQWTTKLIDNLVDAGDKWYLQCLEKVHDHSAYMGICEVLPYGKKQVVVLNQKRMQVLLCEPEIVGYTMSKDPVIYNLCKGLRVFFKDHRAGVLLTRIFKVVIWRDKVCYYMFDAAGRDLKAYSNFANGAAALVNVNNLESLAELLLGRTIVDDQKYVLAPVKVLKMIPEAEDDDLQSEPEPTLAEKAVLGYRMLTEDTAICNADKMHLGHRSFETARFRQAIPTAVVAMTYAKISPPNTWYSRTLDKILRLGNKLYLDCIHPNVLIDLTIDNIPNEIKMGPYDCEIIMYRERVKGQLFTTKECVFNINTGLEEFFSHQYNSGILDFSNYAVAIWRQKDMFYLFDPYPRTNDGRRTLEPTGRGCCLMLLNTEAMAEAIRLNWEYLVPSTPYYIHAFKVLKLRKTCEKTQIMCRLSEPAVPGGTYRRGMSEGGDAGAGVGGGVCGGAAGGGGLSSPPSTTHTGARSGLPPHPCPDDGRDRYGAGFQDEENMGEIVSLIDSIQEDYVPRIPGKYKNMPDEPEKPKLVDLDSPTVSVTQVVPPWPRARDRSGDNPADNEDPEYEPTPPPTPPPPPPPEGGAEEEEEEEMDEEAIQRKLEEEARRRAEEEEARRRAEELPPPMPPPPPTPQSEAEVPLADHPGGRGSHEYQGRPRTCRGDDSPYYNDVEDLEPVEVEKRILLPQDARQRVKRRKMLKKMSAPLEETCGEANEPEPTNFKELPDATEIIRGTSAVPEKTAVDQLPFAAIMALIVSYKYKIHTWTKGLVNFVVDTSKKLHDNKRKRFQYAPAHVLPKVKIGHQAYNANIDVVSEGPTWMLENSLSEFFTKYDRGLMTTATYSCAFFKRNCQYYLYDGSTCNAMGLRDHAGNACLLRFKNLHDLSARMLYNKDGRSEDQQFVLSRIIVRRMLTEGRYKLPEDYDWATGLPKSPKSKSKLVDEKKKEAKGEDARDQHEPVDTPVKGYQMKDGVPRIEGSTALSGKKAGKTEKPCHFVCLVAMLMATMHPVKTWDRVKVDTCIEKGHEIHSKVKKAEQCDKRVIKNVLVDGKIMDVNLKKICVINENPDKRMEQYVEAVMNRLRFVIIRFPEFSNVLHRADGVYHVFDPYEPSKEKDKKSDKKGNKKGEKEEKTDQPKDKKNKGGHAGWTRYDDLDGVIRRLRSSGTKTETPDFYTFELTSVKKAPKYASYAYKLSPNYVSQENPNAPYLRRTKKPQPPVDEKLYWLNEPIPWSKSQPGNSVGLPRNTPKTMWRSWNIEVPGELYSLFGTLHPKNAMFAPENRGKQYLCTCAVALVMTKTCKLSAWTPSFLDGIVKNGDKYYSSIGDSVRAKNKDKNYEMTIEDLGSGYKDMYPYSFTTKYEQVIFGYVYNIYPDRFNLSKALSYFFEKHDLGILTSYVKNLAFGRKGSSYFMYDCQTSGGPVYSGGQAGTYILKCETFNRLVHGMTVAINSKRHGQQFHLYSANINVQEKSSEKPADKDKKSDKDKQEKAKKPDKKEKPQKPDKKEKPKKPDKTA